MLSRILKVLAKIGLWVVGVIFYIPWTCYRCLGQAQPDDPSQMDGPIIKTPADAMAHRQIDLATRK